MNSKVKRTVVGSFPKQPLPVPEAIRYLADLQLHYGINPISDGEQHYDMIGYFDQIPGLGRGPLGLSVMDEIRPPEHPDTFYKIEDYLFLRRYLDSIGRRDVGIKTAITGPITLGLTCASKGVKYYRRADDVRLYIDLSKALRSLIERLLNLGAYVQIDEPGLSARYMNPKEAVEIINDMLSGVRGEALERVSIHICGDLSKVRGLIDSILNLRLKVLSLAFSGEHERGNVQLFSKAQLEGSLKKIGVGCVATSIETVDDVDDVEKILNRLVELEGRLGYGNIAYFHPDCGLRSLSMDTVEKILKHMELAANLLEARLSSLESR